MVIQGIIHTKKGAQMEFKDYYQTLGLTKTASQDDIKKAYRKLARKYHPDVSKEANAEVHMKEVNEAYAVLSDIEKRAAYDRVGEGYREGQEFRAPPDWDAGFEFSGSENADVSDFFENLFGRMRHGQTRQHGHAPLRGEDQHAKIIIDLFDSYQGGVRQLILGVPQMDSSGQVFMQDRKLDVRIPKGIREGQHIRLAGQGKPGVRGGEAGDLFLEVHFAPNNKYHVDGRDVIEKIPVSPWEAALGGDIEVTTPTGKVQVTIPAGSQSGRKLRLKGRGIPGNPAGDLYLVLEVVLPEAKTEHQREIYRNMAHEMAFNPRESKS